MGYEYGDAQNSSVRVFLNQFSKKFSTFFDDQYKQKTLEYFDYKCPYTGEDISGGKCVKDHVIPFNKDECGLHLYGNILLVTHASNSKKGRKSVDEFLKNEPEKLEKIKQFVKESGFADIHEKYDQHLKQNCKLLYEQTRKTIEEWVKNFAEAVPLPEDKLVAQRAPTKKICRVSLDNSSKPKIGIMAQTVLRGILEDGKVTPEEVKKMQNKEYSKEIFGINFPLLASENTKKDIKKETGVERYYASPLFIRGEKWFLCSQWYEAGRPYLEKWIKGQGRR